jgi:hypothetical protein
MHARLDRKLRTLSLETIPDLPWLMAHPLSYLRPQARTRSGVPAGRAVPQQLWPRCVPYPGRTVTTQLAAQAAVRTRRAPPGRRVPST